MTTLSFAACPLSVLPIKHFAPLPFHPSIDMAHLPNCLSLLRHIPTNTILILAVCHLTVVLFAFSSFPSSHIFILVYCHLTHSIGICRPNWSSDNLLPDSWSRAVGPGQMDPGELGPGQSVPDNCLLCNSPRKILPWTVNYQIEGPWTIRPRTIISPWTNLTLWYYYSF